ncbi:hypothetical protein BGZ60DRAFT_398838 [Tricladium varicosporioides]|nr:hypothetical protein BGZ60DRAFT_398838 [Hymenoscyphus varicosporioides]
MSASESNSNGRGQFQCGTCSQSYSRLDHLARHVRSHTHEKPYRCDTCGKQFSRVDLLRRHTLVHNPAPNDASNKRRRTGSTTSLPLRASKACEACAEHHLKCEDEKPCRRCLRREIACVVAPRRATNDDEPGRFQSTETVAETSSLPERELDSSVQHQHLPLTGVDDDTNLESQRQPMPTTAVTNDDALPQHFYANTNPYNPDLSETVLDPELSAHHPSIQLQTHETRMQMQTGQGDMPPSNSVLDFMSSGLFFSNLPSGTLTPNGLVGFGVETDLDFSSIDLNFIDAYNTRVPFELENPVSHMIEQDSSNIPDQHPRHANDTDTNSTGRVLAQSIWRFVPAARDHGYAEQAHLSLPDPDAIVNSPDFSHSQRTTTEKLDAASRDKILAIVLSQVKSHSLPALSAFPSIELLDNLIQFFLAGPFPNASSWIHSASFRPKMARPELLLAMAAFGAILTPDRSLRKLGFAIQEVVRNHLPSVFEGNNTTIRDLQLLQAYMVHLEIGLWSGNSRKIEISESFQQPLLTMLRRRGRFRRSGYPILTVLAEDEGPTLDRNWRTWIEQESWKRLVYHLLRHDAQSSISLLVSPLISYAELGLPLPESQDIWSATSAQEWKMLYRAKFENNTVRIPSLTECVANVNLLDLNSALIDLKLSCSSFLYSIWGMVWEYRKLALVFCDQPRIWDSGLSMMSRYQELSKVLDYFRMRHSKESPLLLELILMHLHMSLEEINLFIGLEGLEQAERIHASVKEWVSSKVSRQAVWHAGQLVRAAKALPSVELRDFYAVSLFHASLAFWAYGLASRMFLQDDSSQFGTGSGQAPITPSQIVWLDDEETSATYRYISLGAGVPALQGVGPDMPPAQLHNPKAIMDVIIEIVRPSHRDPSQPGSLLTENLVAIMERLRCMNYGDGDLSTSAGIPVHI